MTLSDYEKHAVFGRCLKSLGIRFLFGSYVRIFITSIWIPAFYLSILLCMIFSFFFSLGKRYSYNDAKTVLQDHSNPPSRSSDLLVWMNELFGGISFHYQISKKS